MSSNSGTLPRLSARRLRRSSRTWTEADGIQSPVAGGNTTAFCGSFDAAEAILVDRSGCRSETITHSDDEDFGYADICAELAKRFGTGFRVEATGSCMTMIANLEGGVQVVITDCEATLSPIQRHREGRAAGFYVGLHPQRSNTEDGGEVDVELAYAYREIAPPTAEAIGDLVQEALERAIPSGFRRRETR